MVNIKNLSKRFERINNNGKIIINKTMLRGGGMGNRNKIKDITRYNLELERYKKKKEKNRVGRFSISSISDDAEEPKLKRLRNGSFGFW